MGKAVRNTNPYVLDDQDLQKVPVQKDKPKEEQKPVNPFVLEGDELKSIKKNAGGTAPSPTPSASTSALPSPERVKAASLAYQDKKLSLEDVAVLAQTDFGRNNGFNTMSPKEREIYVQAYNGDRKSNLVNSVKQIIDEHYPKTENAQQNQVRGEIMDAVLSNEPDAITKLRDSVVDGYQQEINKRQDEIQQENNIMGPAGQMAKALIAKRDPKIVELKQKQEQIKSTMDQFGKNALVSSPEMEGWLKLDESHPAMKTSIAAEKLGKEIERRYGIPRTTSNTEYERMRTGFGEIIGNLKMQVNDLLAQGLPTKNPALLKEAKTKFDTLNRYIDQYNRLDTEQFPDVGLVNTYRYLGDILSKTKPNRIYTSKQDVIDAAKEAQEKEGFDTTKYGKFIGIAAADPSLIPRGGFRGGLEKGTMDVVYNLGDVADWFLPDSESKKEERDYQREQNPLFKGTAASGTTPTQIFYDKNGTAFRELNNEHYHALDWNNAFRFMGESLPQLAEFVALDKGIGGLAKTSVEGIEQGAFLAKFGAQAPQYYDLWKTATLTQKEQQAIGLLGATYMTSFDENRKLADDLIKGTGSDAEAKKNVVANLLTLSTVAAFRAVDYSPSAMVKNLVSKAVLPDALQMLEKEGWESLSAEQQASFFKDKVLPRVKAFVGKGAQNLGEGAKVGTATVIDQKAKDFISVLTDPKAKTSTASQNAQSFVEQTLLMSVVGLPGMVRSGLFPPRTKDGLYMAGLLGPQYIDRVKEMMDSGTLERDRGNELISIIQTMGEEVQKAGVARNKDGLPMITRQKRDLAIANFRKRAAEMLKEKNGDTDTKTITGDADKQAENVLSENHMLNLAETKGFVSAIEVGTGNKPKSVDDVDPEKKYIYKKDGEIVTTSGAAFINYLEQGDHEKPESKSAEVTQTKGQATQTEGPEGPENAQTPAAGEVQTEHSQTKVNLVSRGITAVKEAIAQKKIPDTYAAVARDKPEQFLRAVADQVYGITRIGDKPVEASLGEGLNEAQARKIFGDELVNAATELYPPEDKTPAQEAHIAVLDVIDKPVTYKGQRGSLYVDGKTIVFKVEGQAREYELGNVNQVGGQSIKEFGIEQERSVVTSNEAGDIVVRDKPYKNLYSDPLQAINYDKEGNVRSVFLNTEKGDKRTFRGAIAEDIAYEIHLQEISKRNEQADLERFINEDESSRKQIEDARLAAVAEERPTEDSGEISRTKIEPTATSSAEQKPIIARHGETAANVKGEPNKDDALLNKTGEKQAAELGDHLNEQGYKDVVTSDMPRARQTAYIAADKTGGKILDTPELSKDLREQGLNESIEAFADRVGRARDEINKLPGNTAVVTHGRVMQMLHALDNTGGDKKAAIKEFEKTKFFGNVETYIPSPQKNTQDGNEQKQRGQEAREETQSQEIGKTAGRNEGQKGDVLTKKGAAAPVAPSLQTRTNDLLDKTDKYNKLRQSDPRKAAALNDLRLEAKDLGLKVDYAKGYAIIRDEKNNKVQRRSEDTNTSKAKDFEVSKYSEKTRNFVDNLVKHDAPLLGMAVKGVDGRYMSESQKATALNDIKKGNGTNGAKALYEAIEGMQDTGYIELRDNQTGQQVAIPMEEYMDTFKEDVKPLTDDEITELNTLLGNEGFDQAFEQAYNGTATTEQPGEPAGAAESTPPGETDSGAQGSGLDEAGAGTGTPPPPPGEGPAVGFEDRMDDPIGTYQMQAKDEIGRYLSGETIQEARGQESEAPQEYADMVALELAFQDGQNMVTAAKAAWGSDILESGPKIIDYARSQMKDAEVLYKKVTLLGSLMNDIHTARNEARDKEQYSRLNQLNQLLRRVDEIYQRTIRDPSKALNAGRLINLERRLQGIDGGGAPAEPLILGKGPIEARDKMIEAEKIKDVDDKTAEQQPLKSEAEAQIQIKEQKGSAEKKIEKEKKKKESMKERPAKEFKEEAQRLLSDEKDLKASKVERLRREFIDKLKDSFNNLNC